MRHIMKKIVILCLIFSFAFVVSQAYVFAEEEGKAAVHKVNINTAPLDELTQLKGIGPQIAQKIIDYRDTNGPFKTLEDLMNVKGIGSKTFETIKDHIVLK